MTRRSLAITVLMVALTAGCASPESSKHLADPQPTTNATSATGWTVTSAYPDCVTDTQQYLDYLETGQPSSLDLKYGSEREYVQNRSGDTRRIELTKLAATHVEACELQHSAEQGRQRMAAEATSQQQARDAALRKEATTCARVHGQWGGASCYLTYVSPQWGSTGGYSVFFDENGNVTGDRNGCPDRNWHPDTHICVA